MDIKFNQIKNYKIEVFVPVDSKNVVLEAIRALKVGKIGNYYNCITITEVKSTWTANESANPYLGVAGENCEADEVKIETRCKCEELEELVVAIKKAHPYEEVCINVIPLI